MTDQAPAPPGDSKPLGGPLPPGEAILTFLSSVGRRSESRRYLKLFRELPRHAFAIVSPEYSVLHRASASLLEQVDFLLELGLPTVLAPGALDPVDRHDVEALVEGWPSPHRAPALIRDEVPDLVERCRALLDQGRVVVLPFLGDLDEPDRQEVLAKLARGLGTRKLVLLRRRGGVVTRDPEARGGTKLLSVVNLRSDVAELLRTDAGGPPLDAWDRRLLTWSEALLQHGPFPGLSLSIASPFDLLRELFTVKGAGTLLKPGVDVVRADSYASVDRARLQGLVEQAFGMRLVERFFERPPTSVFLESNYRGAAIVERASAGDFLTKFVVDPIAQGEGIGRDVWRTMVRAHPRLYWRARRTNPVTNWYVSQCDGMAKVGIWQVFWRGIEPERVPELVADALARPQDLEGGVAPPGGPPVVE